ncbi:MAG: alpha/beta hydrolase [Gammaproteobacteria bacterium]|nr:alpha/beta hydrolase [Gammaproteobacteria bacterium]
MTKTPQFMISNRNLDDDGLGDSLDKLRYFEAAPGADPAVFNSWKEIKADQFKLRLQQLAGKYPLVPEEDNEDQKHVSLFVHGYNTDWQTAVTRYAQIKSDIYDASELGLLILFAWPSNGSVAGYLPDREDARGSGGDVATLLTALHAHLVELQQVAVQTQNPKKFCRAKVSVIAHSMGAFVIQKGLAIAAKQLNSPQLVTLVHQLVLVAGDVDNDLFQKDKPNDSDGSLMANLCYRIGCLYTGLDEVLGASAGLKHFGTRRLGRSGLAEPKHNTWDNVFDWDVSRLIDQSQKTHSAVFDSAPSRALLEKILRGVDRGHLMD